MDKISPKRAEVAWVLLVRAQQKILAKIEFALKKAGLPPLSWYDVLLEVGRDPDAGLRQYEIGERVLLSKDNLSRLVDRLERGGLVKRQPCDSDGRGITVKITKKGLHLKQSMWPVYSKAIHELVEQPLTATQLHSFSGIMRQLLEK